MHEELRELNGNAAILVISPLKSIIEHQLQEMELLGHPAKDISPSPLPPPLFVPATQATTYINNNGCLARLTNKSCFAVDNRVKSILS